MVPMEQPERKEFKVKLEQQGLTDWMALMVQPDRKEYREKLETMVLLVQ